MRSAPFPLAIRSTRASARPRGLCWRQLVLGFALGLALGGPALALADGRQLIVQAPLARLACIAEARVVAAVLAAARGSIVVFEQREVADQSVLVELREGGVLRGSRALAASTGDCAALTEATSFVARALLARHPEVPPPAPEAPPEAAPSAAPPAPRTPVAPPRTPRWQGGVIGRAGLNAGLFDAWAGSSSGGVIARRGRFGASLEGVGWGRAGALSRNGGELHLWAAAGRLAGCADLVDGPWGLGLGLCARAELGGLYARASGFAGRNQRKTLPFLTLSPVLSAHWTGPGGFRLGIEGGPSVAVIRPRFTVASAAVSGEGAVGERPLLSSARWGASVDLLLAKIF